MDTGEVIKIVGSLSKPDFLEVYHKTTFECHRELEDGEPQKVEVEIFDAGPEEKHNRYHASAKTEDGKVASGNPAEDIQMVLLTLHWDDLDK